MLFRSQVSQIMSITIKIATASNYEPWVVRVVERAPHHSGHLRHGFVQLERMFR